MIDPDGVEDADASDDPVEVGEALDVPDDAATPPTEPSDQPSLPDFNP